MTQLRSMGLIKLHKIMQLVKHAPQSKYIAFYTYNSDSFLFFLFFLKKLGPIEARDMMKSQSCKDREMTTLTHLNIPDRPAK